MPKINILPKSVAELIAAGEVVERPASVIKELVENSIDAGAKNITVEIRGGGIKYIRVTDDGCGIAREDVRTAFISHATSKIKTSADLDSVFTLGFRGEALPSIAAVSRLSLLTRTEEEEIGSNFVIEGGEEVSLDDAGCPVGTTFIIRDLFYNTPARMKFLKRDITEGTYASDIVTKTAISHPDIRFTMIKDGKNILNTSGNGDLYSTVFAAFGKEIAEALIPCEYEINSIRINGFISRPLNNRPNRNLQYFFVNGRFVRIPAAAPALDEAYKNRIMVGKFPMCFLFVDIPADKIDVNVHPAKTEIRFSDERAIFEAVFYSAKSALAKGDTVRPSISLKDKPNLLSKPMPETQQLKMNTAAKQEVKTEIIHQSPVKFEGPVLRDTSFERKTIDAVEPVKNIGTAVEKPAENKASDNFVKTIPLKEDVTTEIVDEKSRPFTSAYEKKIREEKFTDVQPVVPAASIPPVPASVRKPDIDIIYDEPEEQPEIKIIGEVFKTYIIVERGTKLLIIDKHAAHERMIFDSLRKRVGGEGSQLMMIPVSVHLSAKEYAAVLDNLEIFSAAGYVVEDFGSGTVIVRECPTELQQTDIVSVITELAGELLKGNMRPTPEKLDWLYHSTACRAAIKAGDDLKPQETEELVKKLLSDENIRYCPHGRPVLYELSKSELEKQFGRLG